MSARSADRFQDAKDFTQLFLSCHHHHSSRAHGLAKASKRDAPYGYAIIGHVLAHARISDVSLSSTTIMAIELIPLPLPASADASKFISFGRQVKGVNPGSLTPEEFEQVKEALYKVRGRCTRSHLTDLATARCSLIPRCRVIARAAVRINQGAVHEVY